MSIAWLQQAATESRPGGHRLVTLLLAILAADIEEPTSCPSWTIATSSKIQRVAVGSLSSSETRIRVATVLTCYRQGMSVEEIVQQYPPLKPADVHDALAYAYDHMDEIETDLAADTEAIVKAGGTST